MALKMKTWMETHRPDAVARRIAAFGENTVFAQKCATCDGSGAQLTASGHVKCSRTENGKPVEVNEEQAQSCTRHPTSKRAAAAAPQSYQPGDGMRVAKAIFATAQA